VAGDGGIGAGAAQSEADADLDDAVARRVGGGTVPPGRGAGGAELNDAVAAGVGGLGVVCRALAGVSSPDAERVPRCGGVGARNHPRE